MTVRCKLTNTPREQWQKEVIQFDYRDSKQRVIGTQVRRWEADAEPVPEGWDGGYWSIAPGHYFCADVQATRNGITYGAGQPTKYFSSHQEREQWIAIRVAASGKAAAKKGGAR